MINLILKFVASSRSAGLRISSAEVLDCANQLQMIDILDETQFETVLRANFAKSIQEQYKFNYLYQLFFHEMREDAGIINAEGISHHVEKILDDIKNSSEPNLFLQATINFLQGDPSAFLEALQQIQSAEAVPDQEFNLNMTPLIHRLSIMLTLNQIKNTASKFLEKNRNKINWEVRQNIATFFNKKIDSAQNLLSQKNATPFESFEKQTSHAKRLNQLNKRSFSSLSPKEVEDMRETIEQLVRKLKDAMNRRYASRNRGVLDIKKTLRRSAKYQGVPIELVYRKKPPKKSKLVVLCDVSGSVWYTARFMLNMLYSLQECFTKVRSFIFVAGLFEVTRFFENHEINRAIDKVLSGADMNYDAATDYGLTLRQFKKNHMDILNKKTTLIIIGDGRTNYTNPQGDIFEEMREKSRRIIWLHPDDDRFWYTGDSAMRTYQRHCHEVRECQNLGQLLKFARELIL